MTVNRTLISVNVCPTCAADCPVGQSTTPNQGCQTTGCLVFADSPTNTTCVDCVQAGYTAENNGAICSEWFPRKRDSRCVSCHSEQLGAIGKGFVGAEPWVWAQGSI
jgi:hypothetical protein